MLGTTLFIRISVTRFNSWAITNLEYIQLEYVLLLNEYTSKHNVGAVCSEEETDLIIQGQDTAPSSTYLHDFIDIRLVGKFLFHLK